MILLGNIIIEVVLWLTLFYITVPKRLTKWAVDKFGYNYLLNCCIREYSTKKDSIEISIKHLVFLIISDHWIYFSIKHNVHPLIIICLSNFLD